MERRAGTELELLITDEVKGVANVMPILDKGASLNHWALLMPRAEQSLSNFAKGPISETQAVPIFIDVARALDGVSKVRTTHYDGVGIVHRDLKPENVLLWNDSWHLTDFGIARYAEKASGRNTRSHLMTRQYASPEQWINERATAQTDVYAFGVMAFELLAGNRPFEEPNLRDKHISAEPPVLTGINPSLIAIVSMCLYKDPADRPTPEGLLRLLENMPARFGRKTGFASLQQANLEVIIDYGHTVRDQFQERGLKPAHLRQRLRTFAYESTDTEHRADQPQGPYSDAYIISTQLKKTIIRLAPACENLETKSGWSLRLGSATLSFSDVAEPSEIDLANLPFTVIAYCEVHVSSVSNDGRAHSMWFCDAKREGDFQWFETAFVRGNQRRPFSPFALRPAGEEAIAALTSRQGTGNCDVAWPFTPLDVGDLSLFLERWARWLSVASQGGIIAKYTHPFEAAGSWREASNSPKIYVEERRQPPAPLEQTRTRLFPWRPTLRFALFALFVAALLVIPLQLRNNGVDQTARTAGFKCHVAFGPTSSDATSKNTSFPCNAIPRDQIGRQSMWIFVKLEEMRFGTAKEHGISIQCSEPTHSLSGSSVGMSNLLNYLEAEVSWNVDKPVSPLPVQLTCQVLKGDVPVRTESFELQTNPAF